MATAKAWEVTDEFWSRVEPLIPVRQRVAEQTYKRKTGGGRKPKDPRLVFEGIVTEVPARFMPAFSSGRRPVYSKPCGNWGLPSTTNLKALPGDGRALTVQ